MRVLVTYGSKRGGTQDLADAIGATLREAGHRVDVRDAEEPEGLDAYDAVVVGSALYMFRWMWRVSRFLGRHRDELERLPVWFSSSGPLDHSPREQVIPPVKSVKRWMKRLHVRGHVTFGGRLAADAKGFMAQAMVKNGHAGDFRDFDQARAWAFDLATELHALPDRVVRPAGATERRRWIRRAVTVLCLFTGLTALAGGLELATWRSGASWLPPPSVLEHTPFRDFFVPGVLLFCFVGLTNLLAALLESRRSRWGEAAAMVAGVAIVAWIVSEMALLGTATFLEVAYLVIGAATLAGATWLFARRRAALRAHVA